MKRILVSILILVMILSCGVYANTPTDNGISVTPTVTDKMVKIEGVTADQSSAVTILVSDASRKYYINQGMTDGQGNFVFEFSLPNYQSYIVDIKVGGNRETFELVLAENGNDGSDDDNNDGSDDGDNGTDDGDDGSDNGDDGSNDTTDGINVISVVTDKMVKITGIADESSTVTILVSDSSRKYYINQGMTDGQGNFEFEFSLPNYQMYDAVVKVAGESKSFEILLVETDNNDGGNDSGNEDDNNKDGNAPGTNDDEELDDDATPEASLIFTDITSSHWAGSYIEDLKKRDVLNGYEDGSFRPEQNITRAEFLSMVVKAFKVKEQAGADFSDTKNHWARKLVQTGTINGIVKGYGDDTFRPDRNISRAEIASIIMNISDLGNNYQYTKEFVDYADIPVWAVEAVDYATGHGIVNGYTDNTLRPNHLATRAEAAKMISVLLERAENQ